MNLKNISFEIESDGFHILDPGNEIADGAIFNVRYELAAGWVCKDVEFERDRPTLFHPFRRSMFIYTGAEPLRICILDPSGDSLTGIPRASSQGDFDTFYEGHNFQTYPEPNDSVWRDGPLPSFFGTHFHDARLDDGFLETDAAQNLAQQDVNEGLGKGLGEGLGEGVLEESLAPGTEREIEACDDCGWAESDAAEPNAYS